MTEIERIISKGVIPSSFLEEETRCDYTVTKSMKKIWAVGIDLFFEFEKICKKHNLQYFAEGGTMIGAVRHKGFIPWDDDIDILMKREDFDKFLSIAPSELSEPYFLQTPLSDVDYPLDIVKLRNSNTTAITRNNIAAENDNSNKGIGISIFPLDNYPASKLRRKFILKYARFFQVCNDAYVYNVNKHFLARFLNKFTHLPFIKYDLRRNVKRLHKMTSSSKINKTGKVWLAHYLPIVYKRIVFNESCFDSAVDFPFEFFTIKIPCGYEEYLTTVYGNYLEFPPVEERGQHDYVYDPEVPYEESYKKIKNG